jgi:hypothetical protein
VARRVFQPFSWKFSVDRPQCASPLARKTVTACRPTRDLVDTRDGGLTLGRSTS